MINSRLQAFSPLFCKKTPGAGGPGGLLGQRGNQVFSQPGFSLEELLELLPPLLGVLGVLGVAAEPVCL